MEMIYLSKLNLKNLSSSKYKKIQKKQWKKNFGCDQNDII